MTGKPVATIGSMHVCPMCSGTVPHVGGPIVGPGSPNVLINGKPAAIIGDICTCAAVPDTIVQGNPTVLINGKPVACVGDMTAHGGTITSGEPTVIIGSSTVSDYKIREIYNIPFTEIRLRDKIGATLRGERKSLKEAQKNISNLEDQRIQQEKKILNVYWMDERGEKVIDVQRYSEKVTLVAETQNLEGEVVALTITDKDDGDLDLGIKEYTFSGTVGTDGIARLDPMEIKKDWEKNECSETNI